MAVGQTFSHVAAYYGSVAASAQAYSLPAINDQILTIVNGHFVIPDIANLGALFVLGTDINKARVNTPSLRYVGLPYAQKTNLAMPYANPPVINDYLGDGIILPKIDEIALEVYNSDGTNAHNALVGMWLNLGTQPMAAGPQYALHGTATITGVTGAWASGTLSLDQTLPSGRYQVTQLDVVAANGALARLIFPGASYRPGTIVRQAFSDLTPWLFEDGAFGVLGAFDSINLPNLEIFCTGTCTAQDVFLTVVRIGNSQ